MTIFSQKKQEPIRGKQDGVIPPNNLPFPQPFGKLPERREHDILFMGDIRLHVRPIPCEGELEIILICPQSFQLAKHGYWVFRPEHDTVHHGRRNVNFAYLVHVPWVPHIQEAFLYAVQEPFRVIIRYVRPAACAQYHLPLPSFQTAI